MYAASVGYRNFTVSQSHPGPAARTAYRAPAASLYWPWANRVSARNSCRVASLGSSLMAASAFGWASAYLPALNSSRASSNSRVAFFDASSNSVAGGGLVGNGSPASREASSGDGG